jgi:adenylate cyclase
MPKTVGILDDENARLDVDRPVSVTAINPEIVWALWKVSLRLEMICSSIEAVTGTGLQPPETLLLERMQQRRGQDLTDRFLQNFMEHQVSRIETCATALALRNMANGNKPISSLNDLRGPMKKKLSKIEKQLKELARYKAMFGELDGVPEDTSDDEDDADVEEVEDDDEDEDETQDTARPIDQSAWDSPE